MERKVTFHLLSATKKGTSDPISREAMIQRFREIYSDMNDISQERKITFIENANKDRVSIEVLSNEGSYVYIRLGQEKPSNTLGLRNEETLLSSPISADDNQYLEMCTYAMIDFNKLIIAFISVQGAPTVSNIAKWFNINNDKTYARTSTVLTKDIIELLCKKNIIGKIAVQVSVPSDEMLSEMGMLWSNYGKNENIKSTLVTFDIRANKGNSLLGQSVHLKNAIQEIKAHFGEKLQKIYIKARNEGEPIKEYNLSSEHFVKTISIGERADKYISESEFIRELRAAYLGSVDELTNFVR